MRLPVICNECLKVDSRNARVDILQFPNDFIVDFICAKAGHRNLAYIQEPSWEMLITSAGIALSEGYPMEAVSGIAAGVERFLEFASRAICKSFDVKAEVFNEAWKHMSRQSERQLGAFAMLYAARFCEEVPMIPNKQVEFRNRVIHRGEIPSVDGVHDFGNSAFSVIFRVYDRLTPSYRNSWNEVHFDDIREKAAEVRRRGGSGTGMSIPSFFRVVLDTPAERISFQETIKRHSFYRCRETDNDTRTGI